MLIPEHRGIDIVSNKLTYSPELDWIVVLLIQTKIYLNDILSKITESLLSSCKIKTTDKFYNWELSCKTPTLTTMPFVVDVHGRLKLADRFFCELLSLGQLSLKHRGVYILNLSDVKSLKIELSRIVKMFWECMYIP